jgi:nicotinamidase-related amidase
MVTTLDKNTALVLIDLQNGIIAYAASAPTEPVIANSAKLLAAFRKAGLPVVMVNVDPSKATITPTRKDAPDGTFSIPPEWLEIVPEIKTEPTDIFVTKQTWNAFYETNFHDELQKNGITGIVLAGVATSIGIEGTARSAAERGYNIAFASDAMTDTKPDAHAHSLKNIFPRLGEVDETDNIISFLA